MIVPHARPRKPDKDGSELFPSDVCSCDVYLLHGELGQIFVAKQKYDAIGNRSNRVLSFEKGEELEVLSPNPNSEWWEVNVCNLKVLFIYIYDRLYHWSLVIEVMSPLVS